MLNILLVEDEKWALEDLLQIVAWKKAGFEVYTADSAETAFELFKTIKINAVITDIQLADMSGLELLRRIKAIQAAVPVVIISAYDNFEYSREAFLNGALDYLLKPADKTELERILFTIQENCNASENAAPAFTKTLPIEKVVSDIKEDIQKELQTRYGLKEFAAKYYVSESYLSREFRRCTGQTITQFIQQTRIKRACELLANTAMSIYEITTGLGYDDYNHFSKLFRREIGLSPTGYRKHLQSDTVESIERNE